MRAKDAFGRYGENVAAEHLGAAGYDVIERNWRCRFGEIDIVVRRDDLVCFVEVKTRRSTAFGSPAEAVTAAKARRLRRLAAVWLAERRPPYAELRFDVVSVLASGVDAPVIEHVEAAF